MQLGLAKETEMSKRLSRRIEKLEAKAELIKAESENKKAILLEIERLEKVNSIEAMFLKAELQTGRKMTLIDILAMAYTRDDENEG